MSYIVLENLHKTYGQQEVLSNIHMTIDKGEFVTLLGPSGCGKSTILRIVAGLTEATAGHVKIDGRDMQHIQPKNREVGMVFQSYALFPNMTVQENVAFGLKMKKYSNTEIDKQVKEMLALVHLTEKAHEYPQALSGGQQQRVALARALVVRPKVLLLDEPLSALDAQIRKKLQADLRAIQRQLGMTMILVTHDQEEAMAVSDKIFVMNKGSIAQQGTPTEIYIQPQSEFIANFIGHYNVFKKEDLEKLLGTGLPSSVEKFAIRPEAFHLQERAGDLKVTAKVEHAMMNGNIIRMMLRATNSCQFEMEHLNDRHFNMPVGKIVDCYISKEDVIALR